MYPTKIVVTAFLTVFNKEFKDEQFQNNTQSNITEICNDFSLKTKTLDPLKTDITTYHSTQIPSHL